MSDYKLLTRLYFRLLPYQVLLLVINAANCIVDSLYASNFIGKTAMSAIGFYSPLNHFLFSVSIMLVSGSQLLVGKALGQINKEAARRYFSVDICLSIGISVLTALLLVLAAASGLFGTFVKDPVELSALNRYIYGQSAGIPALVLGQQFFAFLSMENQTKRTMIASFCCIISNTLMNYIFVVVLKMGTLGLGLGSSSGLWTFCLVMAVYYFSGRSDFVFSPKLFSWKDSFEIMKLGYPGAISRFVEMFRSFIINILIIQYVGSVGLSAFAAVNAVMAVFWPIPFGMMAVTRMLLGISIGEEDRKSVTDIMRIAYIKCFFIQCAVSLLIILSAVPITRMFYRDAADAVYGMTVMGFRILPICMPLSVISVNAVCFAQAMQKKFLSVVMPVFDGMINVVAFSFVLIPAWKMNGLYIANVLNGIVCICMIVLYPIVCLKRIPRNMEEFLVMPEDLGVSPDERMDIEIRDRSAVSEVSGKIDAFCQERGIDRRRAMFSGLAMEEMAQNVVQHGFAADRKSHFLDIRVIHKNDDMILRLRDDCVAFDPMERADVLDPEDKVSNIGLRIVLGITKDVTYQNLLGLNVLTMKM